MTDDIYGKDRYQPSLWQRLKDWVNCHIRGRHHLPIYVSTGVYECSRCDYERIEQGDRQFTLELLNEAAEAIRPYRADYEPVWSEEVVEDINKTYFQSLDELTEEDEEEGGNNQ